MKKVSLLLLIAMTVACLPGCKRDYATSDKSVTVFYKDGSSVTTTYSKTAPLPQEEEQEVCCEPCCPQQEEPAKCCKEKVAKAPKLREFKAKWLLRQGMKELEIVNLTQTIATGYYECNDLNERANLYKLAANHIIKFQCEEILKGDCPTYWVTVELTLKGKMMQVNRTPLFPEDKIDWAAVSCKLTPFVDQDEWGVPTYDNLVDPTIVTSMHAFYMALAEGQTFKNSLISADLKCALYLLETLKSFDVDVLNPNPFYRDLVLTPAMVDSMKIRRMPRLENGYMITLADQNFLFSIALVDGLVEIEDLVAVTPQDDKILFPTICSIAGRYTEADILRERATKRQKDELKRLMDLAKVNMPSANNNCERFEMCNINNAGIDLVAHTDPTLYEIAKKNQRIEYATLRAAKLRVEKVRCICVEKKECGSCCGSCCGCCNPCGDNCEKYMAKGIAVVKAAKVTALGRIYWDMDKGQVIRFNVKYCYDLDEGWKLCIAAEPKPLVDLNTIAEIFAAAEEEIKPAKIDPAPANVPVLPENAREQCDQLEFLKAVSAEDFDF